jgi:hypothetical protein
MTSFNEVNLVKLKILLDFTSLVVPPLQKIILKCGLSLGIEEKNRKLF